MVLNYKDSFISVHQQKSLLFESMGSCIIVE